MKGVTTRIWTVSVPVTGFDKALSFYRDLLGFRVQLDGRMFNWMELGPDEPGSKVGIYEYKEGLPGRRPGETTGLNFDTDDIHELHRKLVAKDAQIILPPTRQAWGGIIMDFKDFDGNQLEATQDPEHYSRMKSPR